MSRKVFVIILISKFTINFAVDSGQFEIIINKQAKSSGQTSTMAFLFSSKLCSLTKLHILYLHSMKDPKVDPLV